MVNIGNIKTGYVIDRPVWMRCCSFVCLALTLLAGCGQEDHPRHLEKIQNIQWASLEAVPRIMADCVIDDTQLNRDYDTHIDWTNTDAETDFFLLVYSNSPKYCQSRSKNGRVPRSLQFQCESGNQFGWIIHGLWANSTEAYLRKDKYGHPRFCQGDLPKQPLDVIRPHLCTSPGTSLLQAQWEKHGSCVFADAESYFEKTSDLYHRFRVPPHDLSARDAMYWMKDNNPDLADTWLHLAGSEFGICFSLDFEPISCPK
jgi:ribonuclease T2